MARCGVEAEVEREGPLQHPAVGRHVDESIVVVASGAQHRVHEQVDAQAAALQHHAHRVDEERHVVGDDEQDGVL